MTISLVTIVLNEAKNLPTMMRSAAGVVDEFIIVDTGSVDRTVEIAQELGATVLEWGPTDNFSEPRNYGLQNATGDWVLHLDADDQLTSWGRLEVKALVQQPLRDLTGYCFQIKEVCARPFIAPSSGRLFPNQWHLRYKGHVHMTIRDMLNGNEKWCLVTGGPHIEHSGYADPYILRKKLERNLRLLQLDDPEDPDTSYYLAITYKDLGYTDNADLWARRALSTTRPPWVEATLRSCLWGRELKVSWLNGH